MQPGMDFFRNTPPPGTRTPVPANRLKRPSPRPYSSSPTAPSSLQPGQGRACSGRPSRRKYPSRFTSSPARRSPIPRWVEARTRKRSKKLLTTIYTNFHGADDDGLKQLKEMAAKSRSAGRFQDRIIGRSLPEEGRRIQEDQSAACAVDGIKGQLADTNGEHTSRILERRRCERGKGRQSVEGNAGDAKPACKSKELVVRFPMPPMPNSP